MGMEFGVVGELGGGEYRIEKSVGFDGEFSFLRVSNDSVEYF